MKKKKKTRVEETKKVGFRHWDKVALGLLVVGTFFLRTAGQWSRVFVDGNVWFRGVDSWYHMRLVDNMMANYPIPLGWDMFATYPDGFHVAYYPLMSWIIAGIGKLGLNPDIVGALLPPILGALLLVLVYLLGKELFNKGVGLLACLLVAILPGELFHRSLLGFTDQHILEVFLMVATILLLILAYKYNKRRYTIGAGVSLGLYCLNWHGAAFFVGILLVWFLVDFVLRYIKDRELLPICKLASIMSAIALVISLPYLITGISDWRAIGALGLLGATPWGLYGLTRVLSRKVFFWSLGVSSTIIITILCLPLPPHYRLFEWLHQLGVVATFWGFGAHIEEAAPTNIHIAFSHYGIASFLFLLGLFYAIKRKIDLPFIVWTVILLIAVIGQRRWGYYFTVPLSLLAAYSIFEISKWVKKEVRVAAIVVMCFVMVLPTIKGTVGVANLPNNIDAEWYNTCVWLRENTPEPFGEDAYYQMEVEGEGYGVLAWWDYGHFIIRISHRAPVSSPSNQEVAETSRFLVAQSEEEANKEIEGLNIRYVVVSESEVMGKFYSIVRNAGLPIEDMNRLRPNSMAARLWMETTTTWKRIHQVGGVKIFERSQ